MSKNFNINKDLFLSDSFDPCTLINSYLIKEEKNISDLDVFSFKLKILNKDIENNIDNSINNISKTLNTIENDLTTYRNNNQYIIKKYNILKNKRKLGNKLLSLNKIIISMKFINNLKKLINK